jgi:hypothetical protein
MLVTLGEAPSGADIFCAGRKNGSSFHESSTAGGGEGGAAGAAWGAGREALLKNCVKLPSDDAAGDGGGAGVGLGAGAAGRWALLKNCVKPPSAEAESDAPGEEKPLGRDCWAAGRGVSSVDLASDGLAGGVYAGAPPETKIRVKSPCPCCAGG